MLQMGHTKITFKNVTSKERKISTDDGKPSKIKKKNVVSDENKNETKNITKKKKKLKEDLNLSPSCTYPEKIILYDYGRVERAKTEKIYLLNRTVEDTSATFDVMGNRGIPYKVTLTGSPSCTCPDHSSRHNRCKHILFILLRIFKLGNPYQTKFTENEIIGYIEQYKNNILDLSSKYKNLSGEIDVGPKCIDDVCAICLDPVIEEEYIYCKKYCGRCIHRNCFLMCSKKNGSMKCVYCQKDFVHD